MTLAELERTWQHLSEAEASHDLEHARRAWAAIAADLAPREPDEADCG